MREGEESRTEIRVTVLATGQPVTPQGGFETATERPAGLGYGGRNNVWSDEATKASTLRCHVIVLPCNPAGRVNEHRGCQQIPETATQTRIPSRLHRQAVRARGILFDQRKRDRYSSPSGRLSGEAVVALDSNKPSWCELPVESGIRAQSQSRAVVRLADLIRDSIGAGCSKTQAEPRVESGP